MKGAAVPRPDATAYLEMPSTAPRALTEDAVEGCIGNAVVELEEEPRYHRHDDGRQN